MPNDPNDDLIERLGDPEPEVRARSIAELERLTRTSPELAEAAHREILQLADGTEFWLIRMNVCRMSPLVEWTPEEYERILAFLFAEVERNEGFVTAWALDALARLAAKDESIRSRVLYLLEEVEATGSPAVRARSRKAAKVLRQTLFESGYGPAPGSGT